MPAAVLLPPPSWKRSPELRPWQRWSWCHGWGLDRFKGKQALASCLALVLGGVLIAGASVPSRDQCCWCQREAVLTSLQVLDVQPHRAGW
jgi:hypothetical protein